MFPTTVWTMIRDAGELDRSALEQFAQEYRSPVCRYLQARQLSANEVEDVAQDVFVRVLQGGVLAKADAARGRFRSLLLSVVRHTLLDRQRRVRSRETAQRVEDLEVVDEDPEFDREWVAELTERAMRRLREESEGYHTVLADHLAGSKPDRQKLWIARKKLTALIRHEVVLTCSNPAQAEDELAYLSRYLSRSESD